jgi:hypothetical protein
MDLTIYFGIYEVIKTSQNRDSAKHDGSRRQQKKGKERRQFSRIDHTGINQARMAASPRRLKSMPGHGGP